MSDSDDAKALTDRTDRALADNAVPTVYFNGFTNSLTSSDVLTVLELNGQPVMKLNMSYTIAKSLAVKLGLMVSRFEQDIKRDILTADDVNRLIAESGNDQ